MCEISVGIHSWTSISVMCHRNIQNQWTRRQTVVLSVKQLSCPWNKPTQSLISMSRRTIIFFSSPKPYPYQRLYPPQTHPIQSLSGHLEKGVSCLSSTVELLVRVCGLCPSGIPSNRSETRYRYTVTSWGGPKSRENPNLPKWKREVIVIGTTLDVTEESQRFPSQGERRWVTRI